MTELSSRCKTTEDSCNERQHQGHDHDHHMHDDDYLCSYIELTPSLVFALSQASELCIISRGRPRSPSVFAMGWRNEPREASIMALRQLASTYDVVRVPPNAGRQRVEDMFKALV